MIGIYSIKNKINNKIYVGQSKKIEDRWNRHSRELDQNKHITGIKRSEETKKKISISKRRKK